MARPTGGSDARETAGDAVAVSLQRQVGDLRRWEAELRLDHPDSVHRYRVATRRLRSSLAAFRPLFDTSSAAQIAHDLGRAAAGISGARDAEAVRDRVEGLLAQLSGELDVDGAADARRRLWRVLDQSLEASRQAGVHHLDTPEYDALVRRLEAFVDLPPWSAAAGLPAEEVLRRVLRDEWARFRRAAVRAVTGPDDRWDEPRMHRARKAAKRARYVAEELEPMLGRKARKMAKAAARVQGTLGEYRDSVITQRLLGEVAGHGGVYAAGVEVVERLQLLETERLDGFRERLAEVLEAADRKSLRRWLR